MGIRSYNPYTPSRRNMTSSDKAEITKDTPEKALCTSVKKTAGRNNQGKITVRHHGGGSRRLYRNIDFRRNSKDGISAKVIGIEYDPNRTANIALICYTDGTKSYILAPDGLWFTTLNSIPERADRWFVQPEMALSLWLRKMEWQHFVFLQER